MIVTMVSPLPAFDPLDGGTFEKLTREKPGLALVDSYQTSGLLVVGWVLSSSLFDGV